MPADGAARLQTVLAELRRLPGIFGATIARRDGILIAHSLPKNMDPKKIAAKAAAIVRRDGLVVTHTLPEGVDPKIVAAMTAAIVGTSEMATIQLSQGRFVRAIVESDHGKLLSLGAGEEALLVALVYDDANLGLVLMAMERAAKQVERILQDGSSA